MRKDIESLHHCNVRELHELDVSIYIDGRLMFWGCRGRGTSSRIYTIDVTRTVYSQYSKKTKIKIKKKERTKEKWSIMAQV